MASPPSVAIRFSGDSAFTTYRLTRQKKKKMNNNSVVDVDKISSLPNHLLTCILSLLPTKQVVETRVVSKTWKDLWRSVSSLNLWWNSFQSSNEFCRFVDYVLSSRGDSHIHKLSFSFGEINTDDDLSRIDHWIASAISSNIRILNILASKKGGFGFGVEIHLTHLFTCQSLQELKLDLYYIRVKFPASVSLPCLKNLHLSKIRFVEDRGFQSLISSTCSTLETLDMVCCFFDSPSHINITSCHLKTLLISALDCSITISCPSLVFMDLSNCWPSEICFKDNFSSLEVANIDVVMSNVESVFPFIRALKNVRSLMLSHQFLKLCAQILLEEMELIECIQIPFLNLKRLRLETVFIDHTLLIIKTLLKYSPNVQSLILEDELVRKATRRTKTQGQAEAQKLRLELFDYTFIHLKYAVFDVVGICKKKLGFLKFLLENAVVLEKLKIFALPFEDTSEEPKLRRIRKKLRRHPHASSSVKISLKIGK